jgi:Na+/H+ antiporter NhaA
LNEYNESNEWNEIWRIFDCQNQDLMTFPWCQLIVNDDVILWFNDCLKTFEWIVFGNELKRSWIGNKIMSWSWSWSWSWLNEIVLRWLL